jgi:hypothetical protein
MTRVLGGSTSHDAAFIPSESNRRSLIHVNQVIKKQEITLYDL